MRTHTYHLHLLPEKTELRLKVTKWKKIKNLLFNFFPKVVMTDHLLHSKVYILPHKRVHELLHLVGPQFPHIQNEKIGPDDL